MTRARDTLHLMEPQRYYVTQQARFGGAYVTGARSRFLDADVLAALERTRVAGQGEGASTTGPDAGAARVDVGRRMREMW